MTDPRTLILDRYGPGDPCTAATAPGRANIIGEHTDYNDGWVLPFALSVGTRSAVRRNRLGTLRIVSDAFDEPIERAWPTHSDPDRERQWSDYVAGMVWTFSDHLPAGFGLDVGISSTVPVGGGMSSSAALEVSLCLALASHLDLQLSDDEIIRQCHAVDTQYVGIQAGVMDQCASLMAKRNHALLLDTRSLERSHVPFRLPHATWVIVDSGIRRALAVSGYHTRLRECRDAVQAIRTRPETSHVRSLRDLLPQDLPEVTPHLAENLRKRVEHVVRENARVHDAVDALREGDAKRIGALLNESHVSLRDLYEVSIPEIDQLVRIGLDRGAHGARIMGGGFGGVTIHLVPSEIAEAYAQDVREAYQRHANHPATATIVDASAGGRQLVEEAR